jgi:hypothetical protein
MQTTTFFLSFDTLMKKQLLYLEIGNFNHATTAQLWNFQHVTEAQKHPCKLIKTPTM